eukprot:UN33183
MYKPTKDNYAVVTGASKGIGRHIALVLARKGFQLILVSRTKNLLEKVKEECLQINKNLSVVVVATDLSSKDGIQSF